MHGVALGGTQVLSAALPRRGGAASALDPRGSGVSWTAIVADPSTAAVTASLRTPEFASCAGCGEVGCAVAAIVVKVPALAGKSRASSLWPPNQSSADRPSEATEMFAAVCMDHRTSVFDEAENSSWTRSSVRPLNN